MSFSSSKVRLLLAGAVLAVAVGCGLGLPGTGDFTVTVSSGTTPSFSWDSSVGVAAGMSVTEYPGTSVRIWTLSMAGQNGFSSPVKFGVVPAGAIVAEGDGGTPTLTAGKQYNVTVTSLGGRSGSAQFTP